MTDCFDGFVFTSYSYNRYSKFMLLGKYIIFVHVNM